MKRRKITFYTILLLLFVFLPMAIYGTTLHVIEANKKEINPTHEFFFEGKLYAYQNNQLLGTYTCEFQNGYCDYAMTKKNYPYKLEEYAPEKAKKIEKVNDRYAFLFDTTSSGLTTTDYILYDFQEQKIINTYLEVKNYSIGIEHNRFIVKNKDEKWGVLEINDTIKEQIPFLYEYIGLVNVKNKDENRIVSSIFAVLNNGFWQLIDENNKALTGSFQEEIVSYNDRYLSLNMDGSMRIIDFEGQNILEGSYKYLSFYDKYVAIVDNTDVFYMYDIEEKKEASNPHAVSNLGQLKIEIENERILVYLNEELIENIAIK